MSSSEDPERRPVIRRASSGSCSDSVWPQSLSCLPLFGWSYFA